MDRMSDAELLAAWRDRREAAAFQALCARHAALVGAACRRQGSPDVDEAAQAVFLVLAQRSGAVPAGALAGWLTITARQIVAHQHRAAASRRRHEQEAAVEHARQRAADAGDPWSAARPLLDAALASLSPGRREAVVRFYLEGRPQAEVAAELGCSVEAVKTRVHEGLERLRAFFARRGVTLGAAALASGLASEAAAADPALAVTCALAATPAAAPGAVSLASAGTTAAFLTTIAVVAGLLVVGLLAVAVVMPTRAAPAAGPPPPAVTDAGTILAALDGFHVAFELRPGDHNLWAEFETVGFRHPLSGAGLPSRPGDGVRRFDLVLTPTTWSEIDDRGSTRSGPVLPDPGQRWPGRDLRVVAEPRLDGEGRAILAYRMPPGSADPAPRSPVRESVAEAVILKLSERDGGDRKPAPSECFRAIHRPVSTSALAHHLGISHRSFRVEPAVAARGLHAWFEGYAAGRQTGAGSAATVLAGEFTVFFRENAADLELWLASGGTVTACRMAKPPEDPVYARDPRFASDRAVSRTRCFQTGHSLANAVDGLGRISIAVDWPSSSITYVRNQVEPTQAYRAIALRLAAGPDGPGRAWVQPAQISIAEGAEPDVATLARVLGLQTPAPAVRPASGDF